ncbi:MAG: glycosyltransferase family 4 protein [Bacteroidales bacterium]|nr:glycosyltransferase family 4 protein [Bacteroidales bacterium]
MKRVLLISNYVFHYRLNNYNYFYKEFQKQDIEFQVLTFGRQKVNFDINFTITLTKKGIFSFIREIIRIKPSCVILFLHLKDYMIFPIAYFCKIKRIPVIYWNFGINTSTPDSFIKNNLYYHLHRISDALLLYTPNEKKYIKKKNHYKTFIANNTLNFSDLRKEDFTDSEYLKREYKIKEKYIVFFVGKFQPIKRLDVLLNCFRNDPEIAIVVAGNGELGGLKEIIDSTANYYFLGEIKYDRKEMARIFSNIDILCIPGNVGLAMNEALFWGKPVVTIEEKNTNSPEIWYLQNGKNGYILRNEKELETKIKELLKDRKKYREFSEYALEISNTYAHISQMFKGFSDAVNFVFRKHIERK